MYYVSVNIRNFIKREPVVFALAIFCIISSVMVFYFSFGLYHHVKQKKIDEEFGTNELSINFVDESKSLIQKGDVIKIITNLPEEMQQNCYWELEAKMPGEEHFQNSVLEHSASLESLIFCVRNGEITTAPIFENLKENGTWVDGTWFTEEHIQNAELVCIANPEDIIYSDPDEAAYAKKYEKNEKGKYIVDGKEYTCIGHANLIGLVPLVPVTTVDDGVFIQSLTVCFTHPITRTDYEIIADSFSGAYGELVEIPPLNIPDVDSTKFYDTLTLLCILMASLSGVVLSILYEYILLQRKRQLTIYRLCGLSLCSAKCMYFIECLSVTLAAYGFAVLCFLYGILPFLRKVFVYIGASYTIKTCILLGLLYTGVISLILFQMIQRNIKADVLAGYHQ